MNINYVDFKMSLPNYHEVLALARELKENERVKLILDISKTMTNVLMNKKLWNYAVLTAVSALL